MKKIGIVAAFVIAGAGTLLANGGQFFIPAGAGHVELVYFARVKDARTGRPIQKTPYVTVVDPFSGIFVPFQGDGPGHFRSPDIGAAILEVASRPFDTSKFEITVSAAGYETTKVKVIPRKQQGTVELEVKMQPKGNGAAPPTPASSATASGAAGTASASDSYKPTLFLLAACFGLVAISGVARTVGRHGSTER